MSSLPLPQRLFARHVRWALGHALPRLAMDRAARRGDLHGQLVALSRNPRSQGEAAAIERHLMDRIRADGPVHRSRYGFVTASHPVVHEVLTSNDFRTGVAPATGGTLAQLASWARESAPVGPLKPPSLLVTEPPEHTRYRRLVTRVFSVRAVQQLRTRTAEIAEELLDDLQRRTPGAADVDLITTYCGLLPVTVIAEILGVPHAERHRVLRFGTGAAPSLDFGLPWRRFLTVERSLTDFDTWLAQHIERIRRQPGANLLSQLVTARDEDGRGLTGTELRATAGLVLAAGFETTVNLLGNGIALLDRHPDQRDALRDDPSLWPNAVDEMLRFDPPVFLTGRTAARDTTVGGQKVPRGAIVTLLLAGANRDAALFAAPHRFDITRPNAKEHLSFSGGRHYCLGAALARMEAEVGLQALYGRFPHLTLHPGARRRGTRILRGYAHLPARLGTTGPALVS
ncbi:MULTISPECIES: cytochrome P450 [unclassified Streptomyces]|uniref:cytochrome P450 n=1 Tax=unclassified Streptomyces TaxID=2593676 RepID=UPI000C2743D5|nr:cytochrome P450 [Streptomyces sp. CB02959]PJN38480.1 cytochrome P450 [Streptomyces sp. CB02959]